MEDTVNAIEEARVAKLQADRREEEAAEEEAFSREQEEENSGAGGTDSETEDTREKLKGFVQRLVNKLNRDIEDGKATEVFMIAMSIALFKDFLFDTTIGNIPIFGTIARWCLSTFFYLFLFQKGWFRKAKRRLATGGIRAVWFILGLFIDGLPVIGWLPLTTIDVLIAWHYVRGRADDAWKEREKVTKQYGKALEDLEESDDEDFDEEEGPVYA